MNKLLISQTHGIARTSLYAWEKAGTIYDELAARGVAIYIDTTLPIVDHFNHQKFDDLSKLPPNKLCEGEKEWFRIAFSYPGGPVIDPRPRNGALKGIYYNETKGKWKPRPYISL